MADGLGGVDASIPLGIRPPTYNPLASADALSTLGQRLAQVQVLQNTIGARFRAGQIMASAPDLESGLAALQQDPAGAWVPDLLGQYRQAQMLQAQYQGLIQQQAQSGLDAVYKGVAASAGNPAGFNDNMDTVLATLSPQARAKVAPAVDSLRKVLMAGVLGAPDPKAQFFKNFASVALGTGANPANVFAAMGTVAPQVQTVTGPEGQPVTGVVGGVPGASAPSGPAALGAVASPAPALSLTPEQQSNVNSFKQGLINKGYSSAAAEAEAQSYARDRWGGGAPSAPAPNALGAVSAPPPGMSSVIATGPTAQRAAELKATGDIAGDITKEQAANASAIPTTLKRFDLLESTLQNFQSGGGANVRAEAAKALQGLRNVGISGITDDMIEKVGNGSLSATQVFTATIRPQVISELKQAAQGTGRVMQSEVQAFLDMMDSTTDPRALVQLLNLAKSSLQIGYDQSQKFVDFKNLKAKGDPTVARYDIADFPEWYNQQYRPSALPTMTPGGADIGPISAAGVKGAGASATTYASPDAVAAAYKAGKISRADAKSILTSQFGLK